MDDNTKDLLARQAKLLARISFLIDHIHDLLDLLAVIIQNADSENQLSPPLCGCCTHKKLNVSD